MSTAVFRPTVGNSRLRPDLNALGDVTEDAQHVMRLKKRAELCQSQLDAARAGKVKVRAALQTLSSLHPLTGSPPKRGTPSPTKLLPPVDSQSPEDRWKPPAPDSPPAK